MLSTLITTLILFSALTGAHIGPDPDSTFDKVAWRSVGEARVVGPDGVQLVACAIFHRLEATDYPDDVDRVLLAWFAPDVQPTAAEYEAVRRAEAGECPDGILFVYGRPDLRVVGIDPEDAAAVVRRGRWWGVFAYCGSYRAGPQPCPDPESKEIDN